MLLIFAVPACEGTTSAQPNCEVSQATYDSDMQFANERSPTLIRLMSSRYVDLRRAARGLSCSGVPLVAFDGLRYRRVGQADDPGIYYFVPRLARALRLRLETAVDLTLLGTVLLASSVGLLGFLREHGRRWDEESGSSVFSFAPLWS